MPLLSPPHPGFFEVLATRRAYTTLLYLLLSVAELHLLKALVGAEGSEAPALLPAGEGWLARHLLVRA